MAALPAISVGLRFEHRKLKRVPVPATRILPPAWFLRLPCRLVTYAWKKAYDAPRRGIAMITTNGAMPRSSNLGTSLLPITQEEGITQLIQSTSPSARKKDVHWNQESGIPTAYVLSSAATICAKESASFNLGTSPSDLSHVSVWCTSLRSGTENRSYLGCCCAWRKKRVPTNTDAAKMSITITTSSAPGVGHSSQKPSLKYWFSRRHTWQSGPEWPGAQTSSPDWPPLQAVAFVKFSAFSPWHSYTVDVRGESRQKPRCTPSVASVVFQPHTAPFGHGLQLAEDAVYPGSRK
mmetsp:Transcript_48707/g.120776  ORF Transcript_48707/g.120776 Transcript_48707/m.120776 type:complete len:293 (+) Transcript_48707:877-1755(+)